MMTIVLNYMYKSDKDKFTEYWMDMNVLIENNTLTICSSKFDGKDSLEAVTTIYSAGTCQLVRFP